MSSLIKTEWLKLKKYKAFWWMTGIIALSYPGINYLFHFIYQEQLKEDKMGPILRMMNNPFSFPDAWQTVAFLSSWFVFIPSLVVIMFITNEYTYKTHRQNVIDGWSRRQFMLAKMADVLLVSVLVTLVYLLASVIIGTLNSGNKSGNIWEGSKYIGLFFLQTFSQLSVAFLIAFLTRRAFIALGIFFFYYFIFEPVLVALAREWVQDIGRFMPLEISDRLIPIPRFLVGNADQWSKLMTQSNYHILYTLILLAITWGLCFRLNHKRDL
jgi:ABC-2 type transport system permease protein